MKDESKEQLESAGRRRMKGITAQTVLVGLLVVSANLRKLQATRDDWLKSDTDEEREERYEAKSRYRDARQARDDRAAPWDNFPLKVSLAKAADDKESPSPATEPDPPDGPVALIHG